MKNLDKSESYQGIFDKFVDKYGTHYMVRMVAGAKATLQKFFTKDVDESHISSEVTNSWNAEVTLMNVKASTDSEKSTQSNKD